MRRPCRRTVALSGLSIVVFVDRGLPSRPHWQVRLSIPSAAWFGIPSGDFPPIRIGGNSADRSNPAIARLGAEPAGRSRERRRESALRPAATSGLTPRPPRHANNSGANRLTARTVPISQNFVACRTIDFRGQKIHRVHRFIHVTIHGSRRSGAAPTRRRSLVAPVKYFIAVPIVIGIGVETGAAREPLRLHRPPHGFISIQHTALTGLEPWRFVHFGCRFVRVADKRGKAKESGCGNHLWPRWLLWRVGQASCLPPSRESAKLQRQAGSLSHRNLATNYCPIQEF